MRPIVQPASRTAFRRRGVTLVEMLVTVAVLIIIMTILVQVFQAATGAMSGAQAIAQIDDQLRRIDGVLRSDLDGVTARFTPPLNPALGLGYFEYGENEFADVQGEDSDDYVRFTTKAPAGRAFTGRMWVNAWPIPNTSPVTYYTAQPITVTSEYAEIIYFLRNGNLYRRVLLVAPELQSTIVPALNNAVTITGSSGPTNFTPSILGGGIVSCRESTTCRRGPPRPARPRPVPRVATQSSSIHSTTLPTAKIGSDIRDSPMISGT